MASRHENDGVRQNGCYTDGDPCEGFYFGRFGGTRNSNGHCDTRDPGLATQARLIDVAIYPAIDQPNGLDQQPVDKVMYDATIVSPYPAPYEGGVDYSSPMGGTPDAAVECGKITKTLCGDVGALFDYFPNGLSFQPMDSDTWFGYLYDIGDNAGIVGTPCYSITTERETRAAGTGLSPSPDSPGPVSSKSNCTPCSNFNCTPLRTTLTYTYNGPDETDDPDCPYPLIFGIGTTSNKVVISYDALSTTVPNGVVDLDFSYSGGTSAAWRSGSGSQSPVTTSQNPWQAGEESFTTFEIYEGAQFIDQTSSGLAVKVRISPALDTTNDPAVIVGTQWEFLEIITPGQGYTVGDTYTLSYVHTHPSGDSSTFTIDLVVSGIGPITQVGGSAQFDVLLPGDTLNGHMVVRAFHTDLENFPYQIIYLDAAGSDFVKDTQYTSSRNHVVTAHAGFGIVDRAFYGGYFEFFDKSVQYTTHNVDLNGADVWEAVQQPDIDVILSNGQVTGATINDGGRGWDTVKDPYLQITDPNNPSGKAAAVKGTFSGGVLTGIEILSQGSGYDMSTTTVYNVDEQEYETQEDFEATAQEIIANPPKIWVRGYDPTETYTSYEGVLPEDDSYKNVINRWQDYGGFPEFFEVRKTNQGLAESIEVREEGLKKSEHTNPIPNTEVQADTSIPRRIDLPQREYSRESVETARDQTTPLDRPFPDANGNDIDPQIYEKWKQNQRDAFDAHNQTQNTQFDIIIQSLVPDSITYDERRVATTQRRFLDMPQASTGTKYYMKQYRSDPRQDVYFTISLTCTPVEDGCAHLNCVGPGKPADFTVQTQTVDYQYTYTGGTEVLGPGCKQWIAVGQQQIRHHMTKSTNTYAAAVNAYGNPFDV